MTEVTQNGFPDEFIGVAKIGRGGTADVYLARHRGSARPVVLKKFYHPSSPALIGREMQIARRLHFPGIVRVHRSGITADGIPFLQMEYCDGPTLEPLVGRVSEKKLLAILSALSASLTVLHAAGYLHNDLKPSNIFCPVGFDSAAFPLDRLFYLKLADFSLAEDFVRCGGTAVTGTVGYMSPEMILKETMTPASDLFSLGVMAYQLACGRMPFSAAADDPLQVNARITEGPRPRMCGPGQSFSQDLAALIIELMEIDPRRRPGSAFELTERLSRLGSPYPFRMAVRPRHLLGSHDRIDVQTLERLFGRNSFSAAQSEFIGRTTGFDPPAVRILLEHNFDAGNFARLDGRWAWKTGETDVLEWSRRQIRFSLRALRKTPISVKQFALALAVIGSDEFADRVADVITGDNDTLRRGWEHIPSVCRPAVLQSLDRIMHPAVRRILASRLAARFRNDTGHTALAARLLHYAGDYPSALTCFASAIDDSLDRSDHRESFALIKLALTAADHAEDLTQQARILLKRAGVEKITGMLDESEETYHNIIDRLDGRGHDDIIAQTCKMLGDLYKLKSDYPAGIRALNRALQIYTRLEDKLGLSHTLNNLGNMYWVDGQLDQALKHYMMALDIQQKLQSEKEIGTILMNIGSVYCVKGDYAKGIDYFNQSLAIKEKLGDKNDIARGWNNLGLAFFLVGDVARAVEAYQRSLELNREAGNTLEQLTNVENLTESMIQAGRLQTALTYLKEGSGLAEKLGDDTRRSIFGGLGGQLMRRMGFYDDAEARLNSAAELAQKLNNKSLLLPCFINLSRLYVDLKQGELAEKNLAAAADAAGAIGDLNARFYVCLTRLQHTGRDDCITEAEQILAELRTPREAALLNLVLLERNNRRGTAHESEKYATAAQAFFAGKQEDIDLARYHLALGRYRKIRGEDAAAENEFLQAREFSIKRNLLPEQWQTLTALSEMMFEQREFEQSFAYARQATDVLKKIAAKISDPDRLGRYYNDSRIVDLLGRIKSLKSVLAKSKGAV